MGRLSEGVSSAGGVALAGAVRALGAVRLASRPMHPHGTMFRGRLHRHGARPTTGVPWLDRTGSAPVVARFSRGAGLPHPLPDVEGLALRVTEDDGGADLLFSSTARGRIGKFVLLPTLGGSPQLSTIMPFRTVAGPVVLGAQRTAADCLELSCAVGRGPWRPFGGVVLDLDGVPPVPGEPDRQPSFDPTHCDVPGLSVYDWAARLRDPAYSGARRRRGAPDPASWDRDLTRGAAMSTDGDSAPERTEPEHLHDHPENDDELADEMSEESFPGSDPPSTWAGHDH